MLRKKIVQRIIFSLLCLEVGSLTSVCLAESAFEPIKTINPNAQYQAQTEFLVNLQRPEGYVKTISLRENDTYFLSANDRFVQCNVRAAWEDFKNLINSVKDNDFLYISYANKMADLGFFDLANYAGSKTKDKEISGLSLDAMKRFYYPRKKIKIDDEMFLAEIYSNILFNNQSSEATSDLLKNDSMLSNYDYANYLVALGSYKSNNFKQAAKYINIAVIQNPSNLNYQTLKAKILAENGESEEAIKIVETLKKQNLYSYDYEKKIKSLEQFILYKISKAPWKKDYHLGYYYYLENDGSKAIRELQEALSSKKRANKEDIYALMSEIYLSLNEFEKASDMAKKAHKLNRSNSKALITLGDLDYNDKKYKQALEYYKKAASKDKKSYVPLVKEAKVYQKLQNNKKAAEIYVKVLKTHSDSWEAYYNMALLDKNKEAIYLKKAVAVNQMFEDGWIALAKTELDKGNFSVAEKYLANAFYIDENDFRYYYYQGMVDINSGDLAQAKYNFKKSLKLNSNFGEAKNALSDLENEETQNFERDNI